MGLQGGKKVPTNKKGSSIIICLKCTHSHAMDFIPRHGVKNQVTFKVEEGPIVVLRQTRQPQTYL